MRLMTDSLNASRRGRAYARRGVTMVEMLVVVALVVLMMVILVQIFGAATGAVSSSRTSTELDGNLRLLDKTIRQDLQGATARMTPPLDPKNNLGYLEYAENAFADVQGEDTDDTIALTVKAPEGLPFVGRMYNNASVNGSIQPITVTSQFAEVMYFLRNGNLYRRVFLIAPERQSSLAFGYGVGINGGFTPDMFGRKIPVSWLGMNDFSVRPARYISPFGAQPILNTLGDLSNRHNRSIHPRFKDDFVTPGNAGFLSDGIADDLNNDGVPDYYPTLYPNALKGLVNDPSSPGRAKSSDGYLHDFYAFPYLYQWGYSQRDTSTIEASNPNLGWLHGIHRNTTSGLLNHAPLESGDDIPLVTTESWWGLPKWSETLSSNWQDPFGGFGLPISSVQAFGIQPFDPSSTSDFTTRSAHNMLPPLNASDLYSANLDALARKVSSGLPSFASDSFGSPFFSLPDYTKPAQLGLSPNVVWDDDLLMVGVRSFDIKAYDDTLGGLGFAGYYDLGYGADTANNGTTLQTINGGSSVSLGFNNPANLTFPPTAQILLPSLAHEGRIPPLPSDFRFDPQVGIDLINPQLGAIGDSGTNVIRLRRVYDTWSTVYSNAPTSAQTIGSWGYPNGNRDASFTHSDPSTGATVFDGRPVLPSYPPPYTAPLRGLKITIKVVDPRNQKVKTLTITESFTDKL